MEEWDRLAAMEGYDEALAKWERLGVKAPEMTRDDGVMVAVEDESGRLVGCIGAFRVTLLEGWWIAPEYRDKPGVVRGLLRAGFEAASRWGSWALYGAGQQSMRKRFGSVRLPLELYYLPDLGVLERG